MLHRKPERENNTIYGDYTIVNLRTMNLNYEKIWICKIINYDGEVNAVAVMNTSWYVCIMK